MWGGGGGVTLLIKQQLSNIISILKTMDIMATS